VTQLLFLLSVLFSVRDLAEGQPDQIEGLSRRLGGDWIHNVRWHLSTRLDLVDVVRRSTSKFIGVITTVSAASLQNILIVTLSSPISVSLIYKHFVFPELPETKAQMIQMS
jgi:hypothetical protein